MIYYEISEALAKQAQQANSFRDYVIGSETAEYRSCVDEAAAVAEAQKKKVSEFYHGTIDRLLDAYSRRLAKWYDDYNRNKASCPSVMISGGSNFPVAKKHKQIARGDTLLAEYKQIQGLVEKIKSVGTGPVDLADPHAREILDDRLKELQEEQSVAKRINAYYRKNKTIIGCPGLTLERSEQFQAAFEDLRKRCPYVDAPYPPYELASIREKIKRTLARIKQLDDLQAMPAESKTTVFEGGEIVRNVELNRLQIIFDEKPDEDTRSALKANGFRWAPSQGVWQRQLTRNAETAAKKALGIE